MFNAEKLQEKWAPVLGHEGSAPIGDRYKKAVTSVLLENQERFMREDHPSADYRRHKVNKQPKSIEMVRSILDNNQNRCPSLLWWRSLG